MKGYGKQCWNTRHEYHKAKQRRNKIKTSDTYRIVIYNSKIGRVKNKRKESVIQQLKRNRMKDPVIVKEKTSSDVILLVLEDYYEHIS